MMEPSNRLHLLAEYCYEDYGYSPRRIGVGLMHFRRLRANREGNPRACRGRAARQRGAPGEDHYRPACGGLAGPWDGRHQYRAENLRIVQVFGPAALDVSPRIGHIHVTVDDLPWHWADASGEPLIITRLPAGPHEVLIELVDANHQPLDQGVVDFVIPNAM